MPRAGSPPPLQWSRSTRSGRGAGAFATTLPAGRGGPDRGGPDRGGRRVAAAGPGAAGDAPADGAQASASTIGRNFTRVSMSSVSGSLSATIPAPA